MDNLIIRDMQAGDVDDVYQIEKQSFKEPWSREAFSKEIGENEKAHYLVAIIDDELVGYIGMWKVLDEGHITNIAVKKNCRGRGVGRELLKSLILKARNESIEGMTLEVRVSNLEAQGLYLSEGFEIAGLRPKYYENVEDGIVMWLNI